MEYVSRKALVKARSSWSSVAFIVESILLLVFLVASLAVLTQVFTSSLSRSIESRTVDAATIAASTVAEHFAADPTGVSERTELGDLLVVCEVADEPRADGTMHRAHIAVYDKTGASGADAVYSIDTARYVSESAGGVAGATGTNAAGAATASASASASAASSTAASTSSAAASTSNSSSQSDQSADEGGEA